MCVDSLMATPKLNPLLIPVIDILRAGGILLDDLSKLHEMIGNSYRVE